MVDKSSLTGVGKHNIPYLTYKYLETLVLKEDYHHFPGTRVTICCLVVKNGYSITENVVCANRALFDETIGRQQARRKAMKRLMDLEHYLLRQRLHEAESQSEESKND